MHIPSTLKYIIISFKKNVASKEVLIQYCPTKEMIVDVFTKGLPKEKHRYCHVVTRIEKNLKSSLQEKIIPNKST
jgi:hypothetical protein